MKPPHFSQIFIVGLPRTGTTSLCADFLDLGYRVAHTAYTQATIHRAQVLADTPIFADYRELSEINKPDAWIYLHRDERAWAESMATLIGKVCSRPSDKYPTVFWRAWERVFGPREHLASLSTDALIQCFEQHKNDVIDAAGALNIPLWQWQLGEVTDQTISVAQALNNPVGELTMVQTNQHLNQDRIFAWNEIDHVNKVASNLRGEHGRRYFQF
jgi:hypothetical protein